MKPKNVIGFEVITLSQLVRRRINQLAMAQGLEHLTGMQGWIIHYIYEERNRDIFQRDVEVEFHIRRSTATGMLQLMEKNGLLTREPVAHDARLKRLVLTPKAIAADKAIEEQIKKVEAELRQGISDEELEDFRRIIDKMRKNMT